MNVHDHLKIGKVHFGKSLVSQDAGIVDQYVHPAPLVDCLRHHRLDLIILGDIRAVRDRLTPAADDFFDHGLCRFARATGAVTGATQIIDDNTRAPPRKFQYMRFSQAIARTRNDHDLIVESNSHFVSSLKNDSAY